MDAIERLVAIEEIKQLKARYFRCMDTKDWDGFAQVFTADAVMDMSGERDDALVQGDLVPRGATSIAAFVRDAVDAVQTIHQGYMPEIVPTSSSTATGIWAMEDRIGPAGSRSRMVHGFGHYHETYEKIDGEWKIKSTTLTRLSKAVTLTRSSVA